MSLTRVEQSECLAALFLALLILLTIVLYWPGLRGSFHFDDYANIIKLSDFGGVSDSRTFIAYLLGGISGPSGRPISLLSFLLNDIAWPSNPRPFIYTNILFHCLNGVFLIWVIYRLLRSVESIGRSNAALVAIFSGAFWLLHPLHISTVLYVVQRMTQLSTLFVLLSLLSYTMGRERLHLEKKGAYLRMTLALLLFMPLSILSKENGVLIPVYIWILESTIVANLWPKGPKPSPKWRLLFYYGPALLLLSYLGYVGLQAFTSDGQGYRSFSLVERLLTEPRVLMDYLGKLYLPRMQTSGLFKEISTSHSLLIPVTTLGSILAITVLIGGALRIRRSLPIVSVAILFFFFGHLLEGTVIMLELYFEHRNYLPSLFLFLPLGWFFVLGPLSSRLRYSLLILVLFMLSFQTWQRAKLWGDPTLLTLMWAQENQLSARAQRLAALEWGHLGRPDKAYEVLDQARKNIPDNYSIQLHYLLQKCRTIGASKEDVEQAIRDAQIIPEKIQDLRILQWLLTEMAAEECKGIDSGQVLEMLESLEHNQGLTGVKYQIRLVYHIEGVVRLMRGEGDKAYEAFQKCYDVIPNLPTVMQQVGLLATYGHHSLALQHLENAEKIQFNPGWKRRLTSLDYPLEIRELKAQLRKDLEGKKDKLESRERPRFNGTETEYGREAED